MSAKFTPKNLFQSMSQDLILNEIKKTTNGEITLTKLTLKAYTEEGTLLEASFNFEERFFQDNIGKDMLVKYKGIYDCNDGVKLAETSRGVEL